MGWIYTGMLLLSLIFSAAGGTPLSAAAADGAQKGFALALSLAGALCLWTGVGKLMEGVGLTRILGRMFRPALSLLFPACQGDDVLSGTISANVCANLLGLGNAATPMGIRAAQGLRDPLRPGTATAQLCRLVVLNTASIQLLPTTVAAVRASLGCSVPFDILPAVWFSSFGSAAIGLLAAGLLERLWKDA